MFLKEWVKKNIKYANLNKSISKNDTMLLILVWNLRVLVSLAQLVGQCIKYARSGVQTPVTTKKKSLKPAHCTKNVLILYILNNIKFFVSKKII